MVPSASRYCTMNYLMSLDDQTCWVIFIVKVSRIPSQSQYIGFQGGEYEVDYEHYWNVIISWLHCTWRMTRLKPCFVFRIKGVWHSVHIDDLRDSEDMSLNLFGFCGTLISNLLNPAPSGRNCTKCVKIQMGKKAVSLFSMLILLLIFYSKLNCILDF